MTETQGLVLNEAMQYGIPAVAVDGGGATEGIIPGENGFATKNDETDMANQVLSVLRDQNLYARLCAGAERSAKLNTTEIMCKRVLKVYHAAINQEGAPSERQHPQFVS